MVIAPRYTQFVPKTEKIANDFGFKSIRRSQIHSINNLNNEIIIIDTFGELSRLYSLATIIFIDGSIKPISNLGGGNNIIEPLIHTHPIFFGPCMKTWLDITEQLKKVWKGFEVDNSADLANGIIYLYKNPQMFERFKNKAEEILKNNENSVSKSVEFISMIIKNIERRNTSLNNENRRIS